MNWAWQQPLKPLPKLILKALADAADDAGVCWPSVATVAAKCNVSTRTARRVMQTLAAGGLLIAEFRFRPDGSCSSNRYRLHLAGGDRLSPAPVPPDRGPGHGCQGDPDRSVIPGTTIGTQRESSPPRVAGCVIAADPAVRGDGDQIELEFPKGLSDVERDQARGYLTDLPAGLAQQIVDELAAHVAAGTVRSTPLAYLRGLIQRAQAGTFAPEAGFVIAEHRRRRAYHEAVLRQAEAAGRDAVPASVPDDGDPLAKQLAAIQARAEGRRNR